jgi:serine/threonine protein kinase
MLADFGVSRLMMTAATTTTEIAAGTAYWMAPELFIEDVPTPKRESDIWAFGCVCYEVK